VKPDDLARGGGVGDALARMGEGLEPQK